MSTQAPDLMCAAQICVENKVEDLPLFPMDRFCSKFTVELLSVAAHQRNKLLYMTDDAKSKELINDQIDNQHWNLLPREVFFSLLIRQGGLVTTRSIENPNTVMSGIQLDDRRIMLQGSSAKKDERLEQSKRRQLHAEFVTMEFTDEKVQLPRQPALQEYLQTDLSAFKVKESSSGFEAQICQVDLLSLLVLMNRDDIHRPVPKQDRDFVHEFYRCHCMWKFAVTRVK